MRGPTTASCPELSLNEHANVRSPGAFRGTLRSPLAHSPAASPRHASATSPTTRPGARQVLTRQHPRPKVPAASPQAPRPPRPARPPPRSPPARHQERHPHQPGPPARGRRRHRPPAHRTRRTTHTDRLRPALRPRRPPRPGVTRAVPESEDDNHRTLSRAPVGTVHLPGNQPAESCSTTTKHPAHAVQIHAIAIAMG